MPRKIRFVALAGVLGLALLATACGLGPSSTGQFDRTLAVTGPVHLEIQNGSGGVEVKAGATGEVRIHAEVRVSVWPWENPRRRVQEITSDPPIEQQGNIIRIGFYKLRMRMATISYTIAVPAETDLTAFVGSGGVEVHAIQGPLKLTTGSGGITAGDIRQDVQGTAGSGGITLTKIQGEVRATTGSGGMTLNQIQGDIRATIGSGGVTIDDPGGRVTARAGSGGVHIRGASGDLRVMAGSGDISVEGSPAPDSYWEVQTGSGSIDLGVPSDASFRLVAQASSGRIETRIPMVIEEQSRREVRGRVGSGAARLELRTGSGSIQIH